MLTENVWDLRELIVLANFFVFNIAKKTKTGWESFWHSVKFTWDSTFVDALDPKDAIETKPKSNTRRTSPKQYAPSTFSANLILSLLRYFLGMKKIGRFCKD